MTVRNSRPQTHRLALWLTVLALLAQLGLTQLGYAHLARMVAAGPAWGDVCSSNGGADDLHDTSSTESGTPHGAAMLLHCPACSAAGASWLTADSVDATQALPAWTQETPPAAEPLLRDLRHAALRPPAQAPPAA